MAPIGCQLRRSLSVPVSSLTACERGAVIVEGLGVNMAPPRAPTGAAYGGAKIDVASAAGMHCQVGMFAMLSRSVAVPQSDSRCIIPYLQCADFVPKIPTHFLTKRYPPSFH